MAASCMAARRAATAIRNGARCCSSRGPRREQASSTAEEALALSRQTGDLATQASALLTLAMGGTGFCNSGEDASFVLIAQARSAAAQAGDYHLQLLTTTNESHLLEGVGEHQRAADVAKRGVAAAQKYGLARTACTFLSINLAEPLVSLGRWDEAGEVIEHALDLSPVPKTRVALHQLAGHYRRGPRRPRCRPVTPWP